MIPGLVLAARADREDEGLAYLGNLGRELLSLFFGHQHATQRTGWIHFPSPPVSPMLGSRQTRAILFGSGKIVRIDMGLKVPILNLNYAIIMPKVMDFEKGAAPDLFCLTLHNCNNL